MVRLTGIPGVDAVVQPENTAAPLFKGFNPREATLNPERTAAGLAKEMNRDLARAVAEATSLGVVIHPSGAATGIVREHGSREGCAADVNAAYAQKVSAANVEKPPSFHPQAESRIVNGILRSIAFTYMVDRTVESREGTPTNMVPLQLGFSALGGAMDAGTWATVNASAVRGWGGLPADDALAF